jgi:hypothetical protein
MKALPNYTTEILPLFSGLTVDGDNNVQNLNIFYAGGNGNVWSYGLWPHSWSLYNVGSQELSAGGKKVYRYQITNIGSSLELGTFCHENGHMLCGFPDIYDYDSDSKGGAGMFCLMNSGGHGVNPVQVCAYLKKAAGWATIVDLTSASGLTASLTASAGTNFNHFYRFTKPGVSTEYFLLENRQSTGRDDSLPASGIAIWHADELGDKNNQSMTANVTHANYELTLVQADNLWHFQNNINTGDSQDLYYNGNAAAGYANRLDDTSTPNAHWWNGSNSFVNFNTFSASADTMTFVVGNGAPISMLAVTPTLLTNTVKVGTNAAAQTFTVRNAGAGTMTYQVTNTAAWLSGTPVSGTSTGEQDTITVSYSTASLTVGTHTGQMVIVSAEATNSPWVLPVVMTVTSTPPSLPVLFNSGVSNVTPVSAVLRGSLSSTGGAPTTVWVSLGVSDGGSNRASWATTVTGGVQGVGLLGIGVSGLTSNTMYYYRFGASNTAGTAWAYSSSNFVTTGTVPYDVVWTNTSSGSWTSSLNWQPNNVPDNSNENVRISGINNSLTVSCTNIIAPLTIRDLVVSNSYPGKTLTVRLAPASPGATTRILGSWNNATLGSNSVVQIGGTFADYNATYVITNKGDCTLISNGRIQAGGMGGALLRFLGGFRNDPDSFVGVSTGTARAVMQLNFAINQPVTNLGTLRFIFEGTSTASNLLNKGVVIAGSNVLWNAGTIITGSSSSSTTGSPWMDRFDCGLINAGTIINSNFAPIQAQFRLSGRGDQPVRNTGAWNLIGVGNAGYQVIVGTNGFVNDGVISSRSSSLMSSNAITLSQGGAVFSNAVAGTIIVLTNRLLIQADVPVNLGTSVILSGGTLSYRSSNGGPIGLMNEGPIVLSNGVLEVYSVTLSGGDAVLTGSGGVTGLVMCAAGARLEPDAPTGGRLKISGDLILSNAVVTLDLNASGVCDRVTSPSATFGGILIVTNSGPSALAAGQVFDLFDIGLSTGVFDTVVLPSLDVGLTWNTSALYTSGQITVESEPVEGVIAASQAGNTYRSPGTNMVTCQFDYPSNSVLLSLLWRITPPAGWSVESPSGDGAPVSTNNEIVFSGALTNNPIRFTYALIVPAAETAPVQVSATAEYWLNGMANQVSIPVQPDPLVLNRTQWINIQSGFGTTVPPTGCNVILHGSNLLCLVEGSPVTEGSTQYVCTGWTGTGNAGAGTGTATTILLTDDSTLAWLWKTQFQLATTSTVGGVVAGSNGWMEAWSTNTLTAIPGTGYHFTGWSGDVPAEQTGANPLNLPMDQARNVMAVFALNTYTITASAGSHGWITPGGSVTVPHGSNTVFTIGSEPNYHVTNVVVDGLSKGPTNGWTFFNVTTNHSISAGFASDTYQLTVGSSYGGAAPAGTNVYDYGTVVPCTVTNSPIPNGTTQYVCTGWTGTGSAGTGTGTTTQVTMTNNSTLTWQWKAQFRLAATSTVGGVVTGPVGWRDAGSTNVLNAIPTNGYHFTGWTGDVPAGQTNANPLNLSMSQARTVVAVFEPNPCTIAATAGPHGWIAPSGSVSVIYGSNAVFEIGAEPNSHVTNVVVDGLSKGPTNTWIFFNVTTNHSITALFTVDSYSLSVASAFGGAAPAGTNVYDYGTVVPCNVTNSPVPNGTTQYVCTGWTGTGSAGTGTGTTTLITITNDSTLTWQWKTQFRLATTSTVGGVVTGPVGWQNAGATNMLTALPTNGYHFTGWTGAVPAGQTNANPLYLVMDQARTVMAVFALNTYTITAAAGPHGWIAPSGSVSVIHGSNAVFTIGAEPNCHVTNVVVDGSSRGATNLWTFTNVITNHALSASFTVNSCSLTVGSTYGGAVPSETNVYDYGTVVPCSVTNSPVPNGTTQFVCTGWTGTGSVGIGTGTATLVTMTNDSTLVWQWKTQYWLQATAESGGRIDASNGWNDAGAPLVITATASSGFTFAGWQVDNTNLMVNPLSLAATGACSVLARFAVNTNDILAGQACSGFRSPGTGTVVTASFTYPSNQILTGLSWQSALPSGWVIAGAGGQGGGQVSGTNIVVFTGPFTNNPILFSYTLAVPGNEAVTNHLLSSVTFQFAGMTEARSLPALPDPLPLARYHSADYRAPSWTLDGTEVNRILAYWRAGSYHTAAAGYDGYAPGPGATNNGLHSADFQNGRWVIDETEAATVLAYWRAGRFSLSPGTADGYAAGSGVQPGPMNQGGVQVMQAQYGPAFYNAGGFVTLTNTFVYAQPILSLSWRPSLPGGWTVVSVRGDGNPEFQQGAALWTGELPASPVTLVYTVSVPWWESGPRTIRSLAGFYAAGMSGMAAMPPAPEALTLQPLDSDADGLPDGWEQHYTGSTTAMLTDEDADGDGMNNLQECLAGTDSADAGSALRLNALIRESDGSILLRWASTTNRTYDVGKKSDLFGAFSIMATNLPATPPENTFRDHPDQAPGSFYRIELGK